jgi:hypothetical protein
MFKAGSELEHIVHQLHRETYIQMWAKNQMTPGFTMMYCSVVLSFRLTPVSGIGEFIFKSY